MDAKTVPSVIIGNGRCITHFPNDVTIEGTAMLFRKFNPGRNGSMDFLAIQF